MPAKGLPFDCGHGLDQRGTPFTECYACRAPLRRAIEKWNAEKDIREAEKRVKEKLQKGESPF